VSPRAGDAWDRLFAPPIAHRGLWSPGGAPENSLGAFQAACAAGYGIELDVRLSADGEAMVFHDDSLERMTGEAGALALRTAADLAALRLAGTDEPVPTLAETLALVGRRALVLIELKTAAGAVGPLERRVHEVIVDHAGPVAVIGFNPYSHAWFADRFPGVLRGLDSQSFTHAAGMGPEQRAAWTALEHVEIARPHFLALGLEVAASEPARKRRADGMPVVAWTVRDPAQWEAAREACDNFIFEGFRP
jgi:glycerophosphoryl diester phosphodiesterase